MAADAQALLFRRAQLLERGLFDLRVVDGSIVALAPDLPPRAGERVIDAGGNLLLPGLHDHHLHLFATAAARASLVCGPPAVTDEASLRAALAGRCETGVSHVRGVGFHESVCPDLDRHWLDRVCPDRPVRIQHRSGMLWVFNSRALQQLNLSSQESLPGGAECDTGGRLTGRFYDLDAWLGERLVRAWPSLKSLSEALAGYGITVLTDTGVNNGIDVWEALRRAGRRGELLQRLLVMGDETLNAVDVADDERIAVGPLKIYLREVELPDFEVLVGRIDAAHRCGRAVAVHCVTRAELHYALEAIASAGTLKGDRIEHASVADDAALERLAALHITVVTQPHFITERGDQYLAGVDADDVPLLYRGAAFFNHGVELAAGSDAPYGSIDPWAAMRAAVDRRTRRGVPMAQNECLSPRQALSLYAGSRRNPGGGVRQLAVGQAADLCLLDVPWETLCEDLDARHVALTVCGGAVIHPLSAHISGSAKHGHA